MKSSFLKFVVVGLVGDLFPYLGKFSPRIWKLSKPNVTQLNSKQLKSNFVEVRYSSQLEPTTPHTNFSVTSRLARKLKFCADTHYQVSNT